MLSLLVLFVIAQLAERMLEANWVLYTGYRFGWTAAQVGISLAVVGVLVVITQGGLVRVVVPKIGERITINLGFTVAAICMVGLAFATQPWMIYVIVVPYVLGWGLTAPAVQSLVTRAVPANEQGILQGAISSAQTLTGIIGPPVAGTALRLFHQRQRAGPPAGDRIPRRCLVVCRRSRCRLAQHSGDGACCHCCQGRDDQRDHHHRRAVRPLPGRAGSGKSRPVPGDEAAWRKRQGHAKAVDGR